MEMRPITFAIAGALIIASAGIGAYLAVRHNAAPPGAATVAEPAPAALAATAPAGEDGPTGSAAAPPAAATAVESTEQIVAANTAPGPPAAAPDRPAQAAVEAPDPGRRTVTRPAPRRAETRPVERVAPAPASPPPARPEPPPERAAAQAEPPPERAAAQAEPPPAPAPDPPAPEPVLTERPVPRPAPREEPDLPEIDGWRRVDRASPPADPAPPAEGDATLRVAELDPPGRPADSEPPAPATEELVIPPDSVIGLQIDTFVTTDRAQVEDDVQARVTRDVVVSDRVAFPAGLIVQGSVVAVERGGKLKGTSRLGVRFHTVVLDDGVEVPIATETVYREGRARGRDNAAKVSGGAVAGAILGAIFGGGRGAAIGGAAGAAGGAAAAAGSDVEPATLAAGTTLTVRLSQAAVVTVAR
jgi:hypothetical protein